MKNAYAQRFILALIFSTLIIACNSGKNKSDAVDPPPAETVITPNDITGCYKLIIEKDSAFMMIKQDGNLVKGELYYFPFEKDKNEGTFIGSRNKDEIAVWYSFSSEGKQTVRQSAFKVIGNSLAEGYGEVEMKNDTVVFQYPLANLQYEENHRFEKINCP